MDELRRQYLEAMGVQVWVRRGGTPPAVHTEVPDAEPRQEAVPSPVPEASGAESREAGGIAALDWEALQARVEACKLCPELVANRSRTVFGVGDRKARWMVIGEAPGAEEDRQGEPFVGRAGQLLNNMLGAVGLERSQVYIANVLKCRPPNNRDPKPEEAAHCEPFLRRQIALVNPRIILVVGRVAAQNLLKTDQPIGRLRGRVHSFGEAATPVVVTYHPAYLLRSPGEKRKAWQDLRLALQTLRAAEGQQRGGA